MNGCMGCGWADERVHYVRWTDERLYIAQCMAIYCWRSREAFESHPLVSCKIRSSLHFKTKTHHCEVPAGRVANTIAQPEASSSSPENHA
jgi:hypothetical protein